MISIIIASKDERDLQRCSQSIRQSIGVPCEIIAVQNKEGKHGLCKIYNTCARKAQYNLIVYMHEDIEFKKKDWGLVVQQLLQKEDVGLIGIAGSTYMTTSGSWASAKVPFLRGRIIHAAAEDEKKEILELYSEKEGTDEVVVIDGVFMATKKKVIEEIPFDEKTFTGFHFYDVDFALRVAQKYKVLVTTDIQIKHYSGGSYNDQWSAFREKFLEKWKGKLPYTNQDKHPDRKNLIPWKVVHL